MFIVFWCENLFSVEFIQCIIIPIVESYCFTHISSCNIEQPLGIIYLISESGTNKKEQHTIQCRWPKINVAIWQFVRRSYEPTNTLANFLIHSQFAIGIQTRYKAFIDYILLLRLCTWAEWATVLWCYVRSFAVSFVMRTQL